MNKKIEDKKEVKTTKVDTADNKKKVEAAKTKKTTAKVSSFKKKKKIFIKKFF